MKRKIKTLSTYIISDDTPEDGLLSIKQAYDENGNLLLQEQYYQDGNVELKVERAYDVGNKLVEEKHYTDGAEPNQVFRHEYDDEGKLKLTVVKYLDGATSSIHHAFDLATKCETITTLDEAGMVEEKVVRTLDAEGRALEETNYGEEEAFETKVTTSYSEAGRTLEKSFEKADEAAYTHFYDYEFDEEGRIKYAEIFDKAEDLIQVNEIEYDENGNQQEIKMRHYVNGWSLIDRYEYDDQNRVTKEERLQGNGDLLESKEYRYLEDDLVEEEEIRDGNGVRINQFRYEFF